MSAPRPHGLLLTGGASTRMGSDKATLVFRGSTLASRVAAALRAVADPVVVVGPGAGTGLPAVDDARLGPLVAIVEGHAQLLARKATGPVLVAACDLPFADPALLFLLAAEIGEADAAVPLAGGRDQPLCACYGPAALELARRLTGAGIRSMHGLLAALPQVRRIPEVQWRSVAGPEALLDVDTAVEWAEIHTT